MKKTGIKYFCICFLNVVCVFSTVSAQNMVHLRGIVKDIQGNPLQFATAKLSVDDIEIASRNTNANGEFDFPNDFSIYDSVMLHISYVNKASQTIELKRKDYHSLLRVTLQNLSLTLNDVVVTGVIKRQNSASSIVFDEEAIRQLQAFSLMDVLNALPGRKTVGPDLQSPQTITLRTSATGIDAMNNSFGVGIFVDGVRISNETNMQSRGISSRGLGGSLLNGYGESTSDVTYNGFDLRDIPMSNIASIEIIQGVGSAKYGDFTNGAILITTKAGKTPYNFYTNINGGSTSFSLAKGFELGKKEGALNLSIGYLNSNNDPRDKVKSYNNINASLKWTKEVAKNIRNSLSLSADRDFDDIKADPDDDAKKMSYSKRRNFSVSNNTYFDFNKRFIDNASVIINYSTGLDDSYTQWLLNGLPKGIGGKDTTGVYEGYFIPGNYLAVEHINGKPLSYGVNIDLESGLIKTAGLTHQLGAGFAFSAAGNKGKGNIVDPDKARWVNLSNQNERPYDYEDSVEISTNTAIYLQDNIKGRLFNKFYNLNLGFRLNLQNGRGMPQPRLSFNYQLNKSWSISSSYGISFKSPSLAHMYPAPTYFDIPVLSLYSGYANSSVFLVYTEKVLADNTKLKQAVTYQFEQGVSFANNKIGNGSLFVFYKKNNEGYNTYMEFIPTDIPVYDYRLNADSSISYFPTGQTAKDFSLGRTRFTTGLNSTDYGFQFSFQTKPLKVIATALGIKSGLTVSDYLGANRTTTVLASPAAQQQGIAYVMYINTQRVSRQSLLSLTSNTHIPKIGFVVSVIADYERLLKQQWDANNIYPIAYVTSNLQTISLSDENAKSESLAYLRRTATEATLIVPGTGFWNFNLRVAKEIKKNIRLSVSAFNVLNEKPTAYKVSDGVVSIYGYKPISITIGGSLQF